MKTTFELAKKAGLFTHKEVQPELQAFAELVRADEREACAKVCDDRGVKFWTESPFAAECHGLATAIRARGQG